MVMLDTLTSSGSIILTNERLFRGRTRRTRDDGDFTEQEIGLNLERGDWSWKDKGAIKIYIYRRV